MDNEQNEDAIALQLEKNFNQRYWFALIFGLILVILLFLLNSSVMMFVIGFIGIPAIIILYIIINSLVSSAISSANKKVAPTGFLPLFWKMVITSILPVVLFAIICYFGSKFTQYDSGYDQLISLSNNIINLIIIISFIVLIASLVLFYWKILVSPMIYQNLISRSRRVLGSLVACLSCIFEIITMLGIGFLAFFLIGLKAHPPE